MKKQLVLTNEEALNLYNILAEVKGDRAQNRNRWKFLEVIEENVLKYEQEVGKIVLNHRMKDEKTQMADQEAYTAQVKKLTDTEVTYVFPDREVFSQAKQLFDAKTDLVGRLGKFYKKIEDRFLDVKDIDSK